MALRPGQRESTATISGIFFGRAGTGNEQVAITCECIDGEDAGTSLLYFGTFTENSFEYTEKALRACGWEGDDLSELPDLAAAGKLGPVKLVIEDQAREKDGKVFPTIVFINRIGGGRFEFKEDRKIEGGELRQLAARMKSAFARAKAPAPAATKPAAAAKPAGKAKGGGPPPRTDADAPPPARGKANDADIPFD